MKRLLFYEYYPAACPHGNKHDHLIGSQQPFWLKIAAPITQVFPLVLFHSGQKMAHWTGSATLNGTKPLKDCSNCSCIHRRFILNMATVKRIVLWLLWKMSAIDSLSIHISSSIGFITYILLAEGP